MIDLNSEAPEASVADFMGINASLSGPLNMNLNALPIAAYTKIFKDYYRDQNVDPILTDIGILIDGDNTAEDSGFLFNIMQGQPLKRAWQHDYFTSLCSM